MLLSKIMMNAPDDVTSIINGKPGMRHQGAGLEAMRAVATAHQVIDDPTLPFTQ